jgi:hypothetical protein
MVPPGTPLESMGDAMLEAMKDPRHVGKARLAQVLGTLFLLCIPALIFNRVVHGRRLFWMGFNRHVSIQQIFIGFLVIFCANLLAGPLADLSHAILKSFPAMDARASRLEDTYEEQVTLLSNLTSWPEYIMAIFIMAFFPALFEEMFFRGVVQNLLERWWHKPLLAIVVTSLVFSLIHSSIYLFLSRAMLGFALGLLFWQTRNIWVCILAHFLNNFLALTQLFLLSQKKNKPALKDIDPQISWWMAILAALAFIYLVAWLKKKSADNRARIEQRYALLMVTDNTDAPFAEEKPTTYGA